jgi:hypothetical protein
MWNRGCETIRWALSKSAERVICIEGQEQSQISSASSMATDDCPPRLKDANEAALVR